MRVVPTDLVFPNGFFARISMLQRIQVFITANILMARIPSVASLQRRLNEAKVREANLKQRQATKEPGVGTGQPNPRDNYKYAAIFTDGSYTVKASRAAVAFFGQAAALGLADADASPPIPRGFQPAKIRATRGRLAPIRKVAELSKRPYLKYSQDADGETRHTFTAPISAASADALATRFQTIGRDKRGDIGEYGRLEFIAERPVFTFSGIGGTANTSP